MAGYSPNPLARKLGLKDGMAALLVDVPAQVEEIAGFPGFAALETSLLPGPRDRDYVHWFVTRQSGLGEGLPIAAARLKADGMAWISWPKKASRIPTDITEDVLRSIFLPLMLVDVKVCAVDEMWSALKFMWRREHRGNLI